MRENKKKILVILGIMFALFIIYLIEKSLPFRMLIYKVSLGWILIFVELCLFIVISYYFLKSKIKLCWRIGVPCLLLVCLFVWGTGIFLTDDFWGFNHHSSVIESPNDSRTIVITDIGSWKGKSFCVYKKEYGIATLLHTEHTNISFQTISYDCKWTENKVSIRVSGKDMEYENFDVQY